MGIDYQETRRIVRGISKICVGKRNYILKYDFEASGNSHVKNLFTNVFCLAVAPSFMSKSAIGF